MTARIQDRKRRRNWPGMAGRERVGRAHLLRSRADFERADDALDAWNAPGDRLRRILVIARFHDAGEIDSLLPTHDAQARQARVAQSPRQLGLFPGTAGILGFHELESDMRRLVLRDVRGTLVLEQSLRVDLGLLDGRPHGFQALVGERGHRVRGRYLVFPESSADGVGRFGKRPPGEALLKQTGGGLLGRYTRL